MGGTDREPGRAMEADAQVGTRASELEYRPGEAITTYQLENWFTYHRPSPEASFAYMDIRQAGLVLARTILKSTPPGPDQSAAIRKVREAVMTANAAIACNGQ